MAELNEQQIALISAYIKQHGIAQAELHDDLLDHVCTSIENLMSNGDSFESAFEHTIKLFGPGGLKQVQQQTFELLTEMNETMKKVTFSFGLASTFLLLAGTIFKLQHWPGAGIMIVLGAGLLAAGYLPMVLYHKLKESPSNERLVHVSGYLGMSLATVGALFKIMHWPGAGVMLIAGLAFLGFVYIPIYYFKKYQTSVNKPVTLTTSLVALTCLVVVFALVNVNSSSKFDWFTMLAEQSLVDDAMMNERVESLYANAGNNAQAEDLRNASSAVWNQIEELKLHLIMTAENVTAEAARDMPLALLRSKYNYDIPTHIMFGSEDPAFSIDELVESLKSFENTVLSVYDDQTRTAIGSGLNVDFEESFNRDGKDVDWATYHFYKVPISAVVAQLSKLQIDVRYAESQALVYIISQPAASDPPSGG